MGLDLAYLLRPKADMKKEFSKLELAVSKECTTTLTYYAMRIAREKDDWECTASLLDRKQERKKERRENLNSTISLGTIGLSWKSIITGSSQN